jgi:hypothetical protein
MLEATPCQTRRAHNLLRAKFWERRTDAVLQLGHEPNKPNS